MDTLLHKVEDLLRKLGVSQREGFRIDLRHDEWSSSGTIMCCFIQGFTAVVVSGSPLKFGKEKIVIFIVKI